MCFVFALPDLPCSSESKVVELGAGTGKFTRLLCTLRPLLSPLSLALLSCHLSLTFRVSLRFSLSSSAPDVNVVEGSAEHIPLPDASADAVCAAQVRRRTGEKEREIERREISKEEGEQER